MGVTVQVERKGGAPAGAAYARVSVVSQVSRGWDGVPSCGVLWCAVARSYFFLSGAGRRLRARQRSRRLPPARAKAEAEAEADVQSACATAP